jgi:corrinoid protein of di/trimethylamine methyltransferase
MSVGKDMYKAMARSVIDGEVDDAIMLAKQSIDLQVDPLDAINNGFVKGLDLVGEAFGCGDMFLPDLVLAAEAMKAAIAILEPILEQQGSRRQSLGRVVIGTVEGDIHDIGKTLVATMLSASGFQVYDLGVDVPIGSIAKKAQEVRANIVAVSSLLTTTMRKQRDVIEALEDLGLRRDVKVIVGGAPVTQSWADEIGADGYSEDAIGAVNMTRELLGIK